MAIEWISRPPVVITSWAEVLTFLTLLTILAAARRYWKMTECHVAGCKRHQWKTVPGTNHIICKVHAAGLDPPQPEPTHAEVVAEHKAARTAARKL